MLHLARPWSSMAGLARVAGLTGLAGLLLALGSCGQSEDISAFVVWDSNSSAEAPQRDSDNRPLSYRLLGRKAPELGTDSLGTRWVFIDFWGMWCPDCLADAPHIAALEQALAERSDIAFVSVHTPPSRARAAEAMGRWGSIERYMTEHGYDYPVILDDDASLREAYRIDWTPTYLLVGPDGTIRAFRTDLGSGQRSATTKAVINAIDTIIAEAS